MGGLGPTTERLAIGLAKPEATLRGDHGAADVRMADVRMADVASL